MTTALMEDFCVSYYLFPFVCILKKFIIIFELCIFVQHANFVYYCSNKLRSIIISLVRNLFLNSSFITSYKFLELSPDIFKTSDNPFLSNV